MFKIAISGKANSGKNTLASLLVQDLDIPQNYCVFNAFANPIKEIVLNMFVGAEREQLYGPSQARSRTIPGTSMTYRQALLDIGKFGRAYDEDIWVNKLIQHYDNVNANNTSARVYVVNDVRFPNEFDKLKSLGFYLIRIRRESQLKISDVSESSQDEIGDDSFDEVVDNNGTLTDLHRQCIKICSVLKEK